MRDGFIKVAAGTPEIRVADCAYNARQCIALIREAQEQAVKVLALPELCLTGYTCGDLFFQDTLLRGAEDALGQVLEATRPVDMLVALGLPVRAEGKLTTAPPCSAGGSCWGLIPKTCLPNYGEFYEKLVFEPGPEEEFLSLTLCGQEVFLGKRHLFRWCDTLPDLVCSPKHCDPSDDGAHQDCWYQIAHPPGSAAAPPSDDAHRPPYSVRPMSVAL